LRDLARRQHRLGQTRPHGAIARQALEQDILGAMRGAQHGDVALQRIVRRDEGRLDLRRERAEPQIEPARQPRVREQRDRRRHGQPHPVVTRLRHVIDVMRRQPLQRQAMLRHTRGIGHDFGADRSAEAAEQNANGRLDAVVGDARIGKGGLRVPIAHRVVPRLADRFFRLPELPEAHRPALSQTRRRRDRSVRA
jgi:hypothetical protein